MANAITAHALAAGIIDRRCNTLQLPRDGKCHADGAEGNQKKNNERANNLARQFARSNQHFRGFQIKGTNLSAEEIKKSSI